MAHYEPTGAQGLLALLAGAALILGRCSGGPSVSVGDTGEVSTVDATEPPST